jgi:hypothetical protein
MNIRMHSLRLLTRWMGAYSIAALVGYALASVGVTSNNLVRLRRLGADIEAGQFFSTLLFDFKALSPTFATIGKFGSVLWLGFLIAFAIAYCLRGVLALRLPGRPLDLVLFPLAGVAAIVVGIAFMDAQYDVSLVSGTSGFSGMLVQCLSGAIAGLVFVQCLRSAQVDGTQR